MTLKTKALIMTLLIFLAFIGIVAGLVGLFYLGIYGAYIGTAIFLGVMFYVIYLDIYTEALREKNNYYMNKGSKYFDPHTDELIK